MEYLGKSVHRGNVVTIHVDSDSVGIQGFVTRVDNETCEVEAFVHNRTNRYRCTPSNEGNTLVGVLIRNSRT